MIKNNLEKAEREFKLDLKDKKILYELDNNSRQTCSQTAKKVGLSTEVVNYRIKKLEEENIITKYQIIVNLSQLDILQFKICLSLMHITSSELNKIIEQLKDNKSIKWIVSCKGNWDLILSLETDSIENIEKLKEEVLSFFSGYIKNKAISILVEASTYNRNYFLDNPKEIRKERVIMKKASKTKLDKIDLEILKKLSENARKPIIDIASELKTTPRIIHYRIKQMVKSQIILGFKIAINYEKLGIKFYKTFIYIDNESEKRVKELEDYFAYNKNIIHNVKVLGNWDFEPEFEVYSEKEFENILTNLKDQFSDILNKVEVITISKEHKFVYF